MIQITKQRDTITASLDRITRELETIGPGAYKEWLANTPVRSGNARRRTQQVQTGPNRTLINANYPYAVPLDQGRSRQAPKGMAQPTLSWIRRQLRRIIRK
jgi:hypothetical protein